MSYASEAAARVSLDTTEPLRRAVRFYERHGFRPSGRVSDFFGMPLFEYVKELAVYVEESPAAAPSSMSSSSAAESSAAASRATPRCAA